MAINNLWKCRLIIFFLLGWCFCTKTFRREGNKGLTAQNSKKFELELIYLYFKILRQITWKASKTSEAKSSAKHFSAWQTELEYGQIIKEILFWIPLKFLRQSLNKNYFLQRLLCMISFHLCIRKQCSGLDALNQKKPNMTKINPQFISL